MQSRWAAGLDKDEKERLATATAQDVLIFPRIRTILEEDLQKSLKRMHDDEVVAEHVLMVKEVAVQQHCTKMLEMINQIIKENS